MDFEEAKRELERTHSLHEIKEMRDFCDTIEALLEQIPLNETEAKKFIHTINDKHPDNEIINRILFPPIGNGILIDYAEEKLLRGDLEWKLQYLKAKILAKTFDEIRKEVIGNNDGGNT